MQKMIWTVAFDADFYLFFFNLSLVHICLLYEKEFTGQY